MLDAPIVIPARNADDREVIIWRQYVPALEMAPFDDRDVLIAELRSACEGLLERYRVMGCGDGIEASAAALAIAKATGSAA
ncbi:hypothetical protein D3C71_1758470 [compost metagenome]